MEKEEGDEVSIGGRSWNNEVWRAQGFVKHRVRLQIVSILQDKPGHMLGLELDFTPPVDEYRFTRVRR